MVSMPKEVQVPIQGVNVDSQRWWSLSLNSLNSSLAVISCQGNITPSFKLLQQFCCKFTSSRYLPMHARVAVIDCDICSNKERNAPASILYRSMQYDSDRVNIAVYIAHLLFNHYHETINSVLIGKCHVRQTPDVITRYAVR